MKITTTLAVCLGLAALTACETREEEAVENVEANAVTADNFDMPADNMDMNDMNNVVDNNVVDNNVTDNTTNNTTY